MLRLAGPWGGMGGTGTEPFRGHMTPVHTEDQQDRVLKEYMSLRAYKRARPVRKYLVSCCIWDMVFSCFMVAH